MKKLLLVLALCSLGFSQAIAPNLRTNPQNSFLFWEDSAQVIGTATATFPVIWQDNMANKAIVIEYVCPDSSYSDDSAAVKVIAYQAFPATFWRRDGFIVLNSRANPDSNSTKFGSSVFTLFDSLDVHQMDTACVYKRNLVYSAQTFGSQGSRVGDSLSALFTVTPGAFAYTALPFDFSPAIVLKLKGLATNKKSAYGTWHVRVYGLKGMMTKTGG